MNFSLAGACIPPARRVEHVCFKPVRAAPENSIHPLSPFFSSQFAEGQVGMWDKLMSVMDNWFFIGGCLVALVVLIGLYLFLKNKNKDEA